MVKKVALEVGWAWLSVLLSLVLQIVFLLRITNEVQGADAPNYVMLARNWVGFFEPEAFQSNYWPPLYPTLLWGAGQISAEHALLLVRLLQIAISLVIGLLVFSLTKSVGLHAARWALTLIVLSPPLWVTSMMIGYEVVLSGLLLMAVWLVSRALYGGNRPTLQIAFAGFVLGLAAMAHFRVIWVVPVLMLFASKIRKRYALVLLAGVMGPIGAFGIRNFMVLRNAAPWPEGSLLTVWIGNNPEATGRYMDPPPIPIQWGESDEWLRAALDYISVFPSEFIKLSLTKVQIVTYPIEYLPFLRAGRFIDVLFILLSWAWILTALALFALYAAGRLWRANRLLARGDLPALVAFVYLASNLPLIMEPRYRVVVDPLIVTSGIIGLTVFHQGLKKENSSDYP